VPSFLDYSTAGNVEIFPHPRHVEADADGSLRELYLMLIVPPAPCPISAFGGVKVLLDCATF